MNALQLFRMGNDYLQIGAVLHMTEAEVEKEIHRLREEERKPPVRTRRKYVRKEHKPQLINRISYAGKERMTPPEWGR